jgi:hypothetical protein
MNWRQWCLCGLAAGCVCTPPVYHLQDWTEPPHAPHDYTTPVNPERGLVFAFPSGSVDAPRYLSATDELPGWLTSEPGITVTVYLDRKSEG